MNITVGRDEIATYVPHTGKMRLPSPATLLTSYLKKSHQQLSKMCGTSISSQPLPKLDKQALTPHIHQPVPILQHPVDPHLPSLRLLHPAPTQHHARDRHRALVLDR